MTALAAYEDDLGPHGQLMSEATSPEADPANRKGRYKYVAGPAGADGLPVIDYAAEAVARAQKQFYDTYPDAPRDGHIWVVRKVSR